MDDFGARLHRGDLALSQGRNPEAESELRAALALQPKSVKAHFKLGIALERQRKWCEAETAFRAAIAARPGSAGPRNNLGAVLLRTGRLDEAAAQFREAARLAPERIGGFLNLGLLQVMQGKYADAIPTLRQVLAQRPDRPDAQAALAMALARRADELRRDGRSDEAAALVSESESLLRKSR